MLLAAACVSAPQDGGSPFGSPIGTVVVYTAAYEDGAGGEKLYYLRNGETETRLYFDSDPNLEPGTPISVSGAPMEDGLKVKSYDVQQPQVGVNSPALIDGMKYKARTFGFALIDIGNGVNLTKTEAEKRLFGINPGDKSVKQYYMETSYGTQDISGTVLGPFMYPMTTCDTRGVASKLKPMVGTFDHYLWYFGSRTTACGFSGLAEGGQPERPTNDTWYNGSANCVVLVQEPGHNFGMMHSSSMTCSTTAAFADDPDATCKHNEYGDRYDPMGGSCNHMNAWQKVFEGWLQKCNGLRLKSSGTYTLQPLELACDGPQVLQIPFPKVRPFGRSGGGGLATVENLGFYYLELRTARGFDETIRTAPTVLVRVAEDFRSRKDRGRHTWLLDMDPASTRTIEGLTAGKSFTDPAGGVSFTVTAISPDSATIQVTIPNGTGPATCLDATTYDPAVPLLCAGLVGPTGGPGPTVPPTTGTPTAGAPAIMPPPRVESFILVDADTDRDIRPVEDHAVLDLSQLPPKLTIRADTDPPVVGSVTFRIDAGAPRSESMAPYGISTHDARGNFVPWTLALGAHTVNAIPFDGPNGTGRMGEQAEIDFMLIRSAPTAPTGDITGVPGAPVDPVVGAAGRPTAAAAGTGVAANPTLSRPIAGAAAPAGHVPYTEPGGCSCRVLGAGAGSDETPYAWALGAFALGLFTWRRRRWSGRQTTRSPHPARFR